MALLLTLLAESPDCGTRGMSAIPPGNFTLPEIISVMKEQTGGMKTDDVSILTGYDLDHTGLGMRLCSNSRYLI